MCCICMMYLKSNKKFELSVSLTDEGSNEQVRFKENNKTFQEKTLLVSKSNQFNKDGVLHETHNHYIT